MPGLTGCLLAWWLCWGAHWSPPTHTACPNTYAAWGLPAGSLRAPHAFARALLAWPPADPHLPCTHTNTHTRVLRPSLTAPPPHRPHCSCPTQRCQYASTPSPPWPSWCPACRLPRNEPSSWWPPTATAHRWRCRRGVLSTADCLLTRQSSLRWVAGWEGGGM